MEWHGVDSREAAWEVLLSYADNVLVERFSMTDDVISRVLGQWLTRCAAHCFQFTLYPLQCM
jgi:hypothetical protein